MQNVAKDEVCLRYIYSGLETFAAFHLNILWSRLSYFFFFYPGDYIFKSKISRHLCKPVVYLFSFFLNKEKLNKGEFVIHFLFMFSVGNECDKQVSDSCSATFSSFTETIFVKWLIQDGKQKDDKLSPVVVTVISLLSVLDLFF